MCQLLALLPGYSPTALSWFTEHEEKLSFKSHLSEREGSIKVVSPPPQKKTPL